MPINSKTGKGHRFLDLTNQVFGRLTAIEPIKKWGCSKYFWVCACDCGRKCEVLGSNLVRGNSKSCGCSNTIGERSFQHGMAKTRIFKIWAGVRKRCNNPNNKSYERYGGRGIKISKDWDFFPNFYRDMKDGYSDELSLDRIDPDGNYEKSNCRWSTPKVQARNKSGIRKIEVNGELKTAAEWSEISGTHSSTILHRINNGWDAKLAVYGHPVKNIKEISQYLVF